MKKVPELSAMSYRIHKAADLPRDAVNVRVAVHRKRNMYGTSGVMLVGYNGKVYCTNDRYVSSNADVRDNPDMFASFAKLSGLTQYQLRTARKAWMERKAEARLADRIVDLGAMAKRYGYKLVKAK